MSRGRVRPSLGSKDSVSERVASTRGGGGNDGCCGCSRSVRTWSLEEVVIKSGGGCPESTDEDEREGDGDRRGEACASHPFALSPTDAPSKGTDCD